MKSILRLALVLLAITIAGCGTTQKSPREAFLSRTEDRTNYFRLYEVSLESLRAEEDRILRLTKGFIQGAREATNDCPTCPALQERLSRIDTIAETLRKPHVDLIERLQQIYDPKTDVILYFHYWAGDHQEAGYLITHGSVLKKRLVFGEEFHD